jgi:hypothetical protein
MSSQVALELTVITEKTQLMERTKFYNHWYERICPKNTVSHCIAKVKQYIYGNPYDPLSQQAANGKYCRAGLCLVSSLSIISGVTIIACTPPTYDSDPQNMPLYVSIPICISLYSTATLLAIVGFVIIHKTYTAPRVGQNQLE